MIDRMISGDFVIVPQTRTVPHQERSIFFLKDGLTILLKRIPSIFKSIVLYCTTLSTSCYVVCTFVFIVG